MAATSVGSGPRASGRPRHDQNGSARVQSGTKKAGRTSIQALLALAGPECSCPSLECDDEALWTRSHTNLYMATSFRTLAVNKPKMTECKMIAEYDCPLSHSVDCFIPASNMGPKSSAGTATP
jgi:hypothetical protein